MLLSGITHCFLYALCLWYQPTIGFLVQHETLFITKWSILPTLMGHFVCTFALLVLLIAVPNAIHYGVGSSITTKLLANYRNYHAELIGNALLKILYFLLTLFIWFYFFVMFEKKICNTFKSNPIALSKLNYSFYLNC